MTDPRASSIPTPEDILKGLASGDLPTLLGRLAEARDQATEEAGRVRYGLARVRLLTALADRGQARAELAALLGARSAVPAALARELTLEAAAQAAQDGMLEEANALLASVPTDRPDGGEDSVLRAVLKVSALAALRESAVPPDVARLMNTASPAGRAGLEANLLFADGRGPEAWERLETATRQARRTEAPAALAGLLLHQGVFALVNGRERDAAHALKEARAIAVEVTDPYLYVGAAALLSLAHALMGDRVNAYAVAMRALVSLEDLVGEGGGRFFEDTLASYRRGWGEAAYRAAAEDYVERRKRGAIE